MSCSVEKSLLKGTIVCPANKSYTHRAIMVSSLTQGTSQINNVLYSSDTEATIEACKKFGAQIEKVENKIIVNGIKDFKNTDLVIDAKNSGTTIRISAAIAALFPGKTVLSGDDSLIKRPMQPLLDALDSLGATTTSTDGKPPISVRGISKGGKVSIPGNISSQFITALMIIAPITQNGIKLNIEGDLVSKPYIDSTINVIQKFGVKIEQNLPYREFTISAQKYNPTNISIPTDFSSVALLLSASVLLGDGLTIKITQSDLPQGDEKFLEFLKKLGVSVTVSNNSIIVKSPKKLDGGKFDLRDTPDLLPPLSILALKTSMPIEIFNVSHARFKETDRIAIIARELQKLGMKVHEKDDGLILESSINLKSSELNSENDHRLFMAFCIAGMYVGDCKVTNPESVEVSYPNFISDINNVGGKIKSSL